MFDYNPTDTSEEFNTFISKGNFFSYADFPLIPQ